MSSDALFTAMRARAGFETVSAAEPTPNQLRVLGRILEDAGGLNMANWKILMHRVYTVMKSRPWKIDFSKSYFIKEETGKLVYAWRVIVQGENITQHYPEIVRVITSSPSSARSEVTELPLAGAAENRGDVTGGRRGAGPSSKVLVGPAAAHAKLMGG